MAPVNSLTWEQLAAIMPLAGKRVDTYLGPLNAAMEQFNINKTRRRMAAFLAQVAHESGELRSVEENLNYSATGLMRVWPNRFPTLESAEPYARNPRALANKVYSGRMGNREGEGYEYRGCGLIMLTGYSAHAECGAHFDIAPTKVGPWLRTPDGAALSAGWFWFKSGCNALADLDNFLGITKKINGGTIGLEDRLRYWARAKVVLEL